jgi:hypothetical protein
MPYPQTVHLKIERAKEHIVNLKSEIGLFIATRPYEITPQRDPQSRRLLYVLTAFREPPERLALIAGDVIQNLRSALDHMAYLLFIGSPGFDEKLSSFPVGQTAVKYKSEALGKIKGFREQAINAISAVEPYGGGKGEILWRLHKLNIVDKHRLLITVSGRYGGFATNSLIDRMFEDAGIQSPFESIPPILVRVTSEFSQLKIGAVLFSDLPDAKVNKNMQFGFEIALNELGIFEGKSLVPTLQGIADFVSNVVSDLVPLLD